MPFVDVLPPIDLEKDTMGRLSYHTIHSVNIVKYEGIQQYSSLQLLFYSQERLEIRMESLVIGKVTVNLLCMEWVNELLCLHRCWEQCLERNIHLRTLVNAPGSNKVLSQLINIKCVMKNYCNINHKNLLTKLPLVDDLPPTDLEKDTMGRLTYLSYNE